MKEIQASQEHRQRFLFCSPLGTMAKSLIELTIIEWGWAYEEVCVCYQPKPKANWGHGNFLPILGKPNSIIVLIFT